MLDPNCLTTEELIRYAEYVDTISPEIGKALLERLIEVCTLLELYVDAFGEYDSDELQVMAYGYDA